MPSEIEHRPAEGRFQTHVDGHPGVADYRVRDGVMAITHTEVAPEIEGRGIAGTLVQAALEHARVQGWKVAPLCSYARVYMKRHADTQDLLA